MINKWPHGLIVAVCLALLSPVIAETAMEVNVRDFGAKMDGVADDTAAFQRALDDLPHCGVLHIPAGTAVLTGKLSLSEKTATIRGAGSASSRLLWKAPGGFHLSESRTWNEAKGEKASWDVSGLSFLTSATSAGTALHVDFKTHDRVNLAVSIRDCRFESVGASGYWSKSVHVHNGHLGRIVDSTFRSLPTPEATTSHHIHLSGNSTSFAIDRCHGNNSTTGVLVEGQTEGVVISSSFFVHNRYGYVLNIEKGGEPMFDLFESHASSAVHALWIKNGRSSSIVGNCFILAHGSKYRDAPDQRACVRIEGVNAKDIIVSANTIQITDKEFHSVFQGVHVEQCNGVIIANNTIANNSTAKKDMGVWIGPGVRGAVVDGNVFHLETAKPVRLSEKATGVRVGK